MTNVIHTYMQRNKIISLVTDHQRQLVVRIINEEGSSVAINVLPSILSSLYNIFVSIERNEL